MGPFKIARSANRIPLPHQVDGVVAAFDLDRNRLVLSDAAVRLETTESLTAPASAEMSPANGEIRVTGWCNPDGISSPGTILRKPGEWRLFFDGAGDIYLTIFGDTAAEEDTGLILLGLPGSFFFEIQFTADLAPVCIIDGTVRTGPSLSSSTNYIAATASDLQFGGDGFAGALDAISIETANGGGHYNAGAGENWADLTTAQQAEVHHWWDCNERSGTRRDRTGGSHATEVFSDIIGPGTRNGGFESVTYGASSITGDNSTFSASIGDWAVGGASPDAVLTHSVDVMQVEFQASASGPSLPDTSYSPTAGKLYRLKFRIRATSGSTDLQVRNAASPSNWMFEDGSTGLDITPTASWVSHETQVFVNTTGGGLWFRNQAGTAATVEIDDVTWEEITVDNWTSNSQLGESSRFVSDDPFAGANSKQFRLDATGSYVSIAQSGVLIQGKEYAVEMQAKADVAGRFLRVDIGAGGNIGPLDVGTTFGVVSHTAVADGTQLRVARNATTGNEDRVINFDNLTLKATEILSTTGIASGRATARTGSDGDTIAEIGSRAGSRTLLQPTPANQPLYHLDANSRKGGRLDGVDDWLDGGATAWLPETADWALFFVGSLNTLGSTDTIFSQYLSTGNNGRVLFRFSSAGTISLFLGSDPLYGSVTVSGDTTTAGARHVWVVERSGGTFTIYRDNVQTGTSALEADRQILQGGVVIGARTGHATDYKADLVDFGDLDINALIPTGALTVHERTRMTRQLAKTWGVPL